jgi:hypothetical protein
LIEVKINQGFNGEIKLVAGPMGDRPALRLGRKEFAWHLNCLVTRAYQKLNTKRETLTAQVTKH